jgi:pyridoxamine 5'-phosphate oxidase family protein
MSVFTEAELDYLRSERRLGRLATVGPDGMPHIAPVGWHLDPDAETVLITGRNLAATKKFRDVASTGRAAIVIDDVLPPWRPRGVEVRGRATAIDDAESRIQIQPTRIVSWGLDGGNSARGIRTTSPPAQPERQAAPPGPERPGSEHPPHP